jgi:hypothetical protein
MLALCTCTPSFAIGTHADVAGESLQADYVRLGQELRGKLLGQPVVVRSEEGQGSIQGEAYAISDFPLEQLKATFATPAHWCDVMILHVNTKFCHMSETADGPMLTVNVGKGTPQELEETTRLVFKFTAQALDVTHLGVVLTALQGPFGTSNYRVVLEAVALADGKSFLRFAYSYDFNIVSRAALTIYLSTLGRDKVGFTLANSPGSGEPVYIQGMRGLVERNTMRYLLAIFAYLESDYGPEEARLDTRLKNWFAATEAYPSQLKEATWNEYFSMKHAEVQRQQDSKLP